MDRVHVGERAGGVSEAYDFLYGIDCADGIRRVADGNQFCALVYFARQVVEIEGAIFFVNFSPADGNAFFFEGEPGGDVGIVIEARDQDFVARAEVATNGAAHGVGERGHIGPEDDFISGAVEEVGHGGAGFGKHGVGVAAGGVGPAGVGIVAAQVIGNGVDDALRNLRSPGTVEERGGVSVDGLGECGELGADVEEVEGSGGKGFYGSNGVHYFFTMPRGSTSSGH